MSHTSVYCMSSFEYLSVFLFLCVCVCLCLPDTGILESFFHLSLKQFANTIIKKCFGLFFFTVKCKNCEYTTLLLSEDGDIGDAL